ncbi:hypothetical protein EV1_019065 [Malus domestica]
MPLFKSALDGISEFKEANSKIEEALAFSKAGLAQKPWAIIFSRFVRTCHMQPLQSTKLRTRRGKLRTRRGQLRNRRGFCFSRRVSIYHMHTQLCGNHRQFIETPILHIEEASVFLDVSASVTCILNLVEITGNLSKISGEVEST